jgi:hypothetical protein
MCETGKCFFVVTICCHGILVLKGCYLCVYSYNRFHGNAVQGFWALCVNIYTYMCSPI